MTNVFKIQKEDTQKFRITSIKEPVCGKNSKVNAEECTKPRNEFLYSKRITILLNKYHIRIIELKGNLKII